MERRTYFWSGWFSRPIDWWHVIRPFLAPPVIAGLWGLVLLGVILEEARLRSMVSASNAHYSSLLTVLNTPETYGVIDAMVAYLAALLAFCLFVARLYLWKKDEDLNAPGSLAHTVRHDGVSFIYFVCCSAIGVWAALGFIRTFLGDPDVLIAFRPNTVEDFGRFHLPPPVEMTFFRATLVVFSIIFEIWICERVKKIMLSTKGTGSVNPSS